VAVFERLVHRADATVEAVEPWLQDALAIDEPFT
jgi:hypothetical protein